MLDHAERIPKKTVLNTVASPPPTLMNMRDIAPVMSSQTFTPLAAASAHAKRKPIIVCSQCHADIVARYAKTPMADSSGLVDPANEPAGGFYHANSGTRYEIVRSGNRARLSAIRSALISTPTMLTLSERSRCSSVPRPLPISRILSPD